MLMRNTHSHCVQHVLFPAAYTLCLMHSSFIKHQKDSSIYTNAFANSLSDVLLQYMKGSSRSTLWRKCVLFNMAVLTSVYTSKHTFFSFFCCPRIGERPAVLYFHYCMWARQGLVHCSATHSPTSSVLLSWCSLGGGKEGGGWIYAGVWVAGAPSAGSSPPVLDFMCTDRRGWRESCSAHWSSATSGVGVCASACLSQSVCGVCLSPTCVCASFGVAKRGTLVLSRWSSDGRQCWLWLGLGMLNRGREGLFELGQQLQQQGEYQAALHCFLSCLLGLTHVQSFTSLPNCLHQVRQIHHYDEHTLTDLLIFFFLLLISVL